MFVYSGCCEVLWNKSCSCRRSLKTGRRQPRQRRTTCYAQRGIVEVLCLCSMTFEINYYLKNHSSQILHQLLLHLFSKLLRSLAFCYPWMLTVISIFSSAFLVHGCEWPTERKGIGLKNYDYVSDEEDSTDGKWVVRKPSWWSQEADRIS